MSIVYDFKTVGAAYKKLTPGWLPEAEPPKPIRDQIAESLRRRLDQSRRCYALGLDGCDCYAHFSKDRLE